MFHLIVLILVSLVGADGVDEITRVLDGDTIGLASLYLPPPLNGTLRLRLAGIDTPERGWRAQCEGEALLAENARQLVVDLTDDCRSAEEPVCIIRLVFLGWDKYGGRVLGRVLLDRSNGQTIDLAEALMSEGLAQRYTGMGARTSWCPSG